MIRQEHLFAGARMSLDDSYRLTVESLREYGARSPYWFVSYSGGKDSTATLTVVERAIATGAVPPPKRLFALYADTRMEFPPLRAAAVNILRRARERGVETRVVYPPMDKRIVVNVLGRGVPPPTNHFRWCTEAVKVKPMHAAQLALYRRTGVPFLNITGMRLGESAARDQRIANSCARDGGECGQGWFQNATGEQIAHTLAPLLHWRVCHVWDWLAFFAPEDGYPTTDVAEAYGVGEEQSAAEASARTGCIGCNLVEEDNALLNLLRFEKWRYLAPLSELKGLWAWLREADQRHRHTNRKRKDGTTAHREGMLGAIALDARREGLRRLLDIQRRVNDRARGERRPPVCLVNRAELKRIDSLITSGAFPQGWTGDEPRGNVLVQIERDRSDAARPLLAVGRTE